MAATLNPSTPMPWRAAFSYVGGLPEVALDDRALLRGRRAQRRGRSPARSPRRSGADALPIGFGVQLRPPRCFELDLGQTRSARGWRVGAGSPPPLLRGADAPAVAHVGPAR